MVDLIYIILFQSVSASVQPYSPLRAVREGVEAILKGGQLGGGAAADMGEQRCRQSSELPRSHNTEPETKTIQKIYCRFPDVWI